MTTQTTPTVFSFEAASHIRAVSINGNPWFSAKDVCDALRLTNSRMALKALDDDEKADVSNLHQLKWSQAEPRNKHHLRIWPLHADPALPRRGDSRTIPYRFRKWVTSEVLPAIRQTGQYQHRAPETLGDLVDTADKLSIKPTDSTMTVRDARRQEEDQRQDRKPYRRCMRAGYPGSHARPVPLRQHERWTGRSDPRPTQRRAQPADHCAG